MLVCVGGVGPGGVGMEKGLGEGKRVRVVVGVVGRSGKLGLGAGGAVVVVIGEECGRTFGVGA